MHLRILIRLGIPSRAHKFTINVLAERTATQAKVSIFLEKMHVLLLVRLGIPSRAHKFSIQVLEQRPATQAILNFFSKSIRQVCITRSALVEVRQVRSYKECP